MVASKPHRNKPTGRAVAPRTDDEAMRIMHGRPVVRSPKEEDMLPEQIEKELNKLKGMLIPEEYGFVLDNVKLSLQKAKAKVAADQAELDAWIESVNNRVASHLRAFNNLIIDEVE